MTKSLCCTAETNTTLYMKKIFQELERGSSPKANQGLVIRRRKQNQADRISCPLLNLCFLTKSHLTYEGHTWDIYLLWVAYTAILPPHPHLLLTELGS